MATLTLALLVAALGGQAVHAATLGLSSSPATGYIPSDGKSRFTESLQGEFQDATTLKQFKITIKNSAGTVLYNLPVAGESGASCNATTAACVYLTNGTTYTGIKSGLPAGSYKIEGTVRVYGKKADGSLDEGNFKGTATRTIDYVIPTPYGWINDVLRGNASPLAVQIRLGSAEDTIEGNSVGEIVRDPNVKVRADNKACTTCHTWAGSISKTDFCNSKVATFNASGSKPQILKDLFNGWKQRGCSD